MNTREILIRARNLIATTDTWCKGDYFREQDGVYLYCILGAIRRVCGVDHAYKLYEVCDFVYVSLPAFGSIAVFNDDDKTTHADVIALFDRAIESAERSLK